MDLKFHVLKATIIWIADLITLNNINKTLPAKSKKDNLVSFETQNRAKF